MCFRVKESDYPPPEDAGPRATLREKVKHVVESLSISHYLHWTMQNTLACLGGGVGVFGGFLSLSLVLTMSNIGIMNGIGAIISPIFLLFVGILVDRWNSIRVTAYMGQFGVFFCLTGWIWWFVDHPSPLVFMLTAVIAGLLGADALDRRHCRPAGRLRPAAAREVRPVQRRHVRIIRAVGIFVGGILGGLFMDLMKRVIPPHADDPNWIYRYMFLYSASFSILSSYCGYKVYRGWIRLGGLKSYVPPVHRFRLRDLPPHPDVDGKVNWGLLSFAFISYLGTLISAVVWVSYYVWWQPNPHYALLFGISGLTTVPLFLLYLRFVKFMERP